MELHTQAGPVELAMATLMTPASERRHSPRLSLAIPVFVRGVDDTGRSFLELATTLNISAGGALVVLRGHSLSPKVALGIEVPAAPAAEKLMARRTLDGEVVRVQNSFGWSAYATRFQQPLLEEGATEPKE